MLNRRTFLGKAAAGSAAAMAVTASAKAASANDRITVGIMGLSRGRSLSQGFHGLPNVEVKYLCDVDTERTAACVELVTKAGGKPELVAKVPAPRGIAIDKDGNLVIVSHGKDHLLRVTPTGEVSVIVKGRKFKFANDVVVDKDGNAYVSDGYSRVIWKVDTKGDATRWAAGEPLVNPVGLSWRGDDLIVVDSRTKKVDPAAPAIFVITPDAKVSPLEYSK